MKIPTWNPDPTVLNKLVDGNGYLRPYKPQKIKIKTETQAWTTPDQS